MLSLTQVTKTLGHKEIIHPLNYEFNTGVYGLLGPNGAGKTTLIHMIAAASEPTSGVISFAGKKITDHNLAYYKTLGFLPQQDAIYPAMKAYDYIHYFALLKGIKEQEIKPLIFHLAQVFNLRNELNKKCGKFSGGMKRRLGLMQAMLNNPRILILDEPTSGLDPMERIRLRNLISELAANRTIIISTHIVPDVEQIANRILFLKQGKLIMDGTIDSLVTPLRGQVWEMTVRSDQLPNIERHLRTISIKSLHEDLVNVRFLSDVKITGAITVAPSLEDAFVKVFR